MAVTVRTLQNFVGGAWVDSTSDSVRPIVAPVTGEALAEVPDASAADVDRAVAAARAAQPKWAALSAWDRAKICHAIAELIDERREEFARELSLEQGKPYAAEALGDIDETAENFRIAAEDVKRMETAIIPSQDANKRILTFRKPNGVYAGITPWNFPTLIPVELIAPGIAVGNTIVMKPSEWTPIAMANFVQIMADAGLPDGVVNVVYGGGEVGERLVTHPGLNGVGFGGSRAGDRPTRLYYEPTIVTDLGVDTLINQQETFGPIVPLIRVRSDEEALAVANDSHLGLQAAVYTSSLKRAFQYVDNLRVGNVVVNDSTDYWEAHEPFGGASGTQSGWGRIGGRYTMLDMSDLKTVVLDVGGLD